MLAIEDLILRLAPPPAGCMTVSRLTFRISFNISNEEIGSFILLFNKHELNLDYMPGIVLLHIGFQTFHHTRFLLIMFSPFGPVILGDMINQVDCVLCTK